MPDLTQQPMTRRSVLKFAGVAVATVGISYANAGTASAAPNGKAVQESFPLSGKIAPGRRTLLEVPQQLGVILSKVDVAKAGGTVEFEFSPRLYRLYSQPWVQVDGVSAVFAVSISEMNKSTGTQVASVSIPASVAGATSVAVVVGALYPVAYPLDMTIADGPARATGHAIGRGGARQHSAHDGASRSGAPWGAELRGGFDRIEWSSGRFGYYPSGFSLMASGPGPVPEKTVVEVRADARIITGLNPVSAWNDGEAAVLPSVEQDVSGNVLTARFQIPSALKAGTTYQVTLEGTVIDPTGDLEGFATPTASLVAPAQAGRSQRENRRTTSLREGSAPTLELAATTAGS